MQHFSGCCTSPCHTVCERGAESLRLVISGPGYVTCRLQPDVAGGWFGLWLIGEKMPVEVTAAAAPANCNGSLSL